MSKRPGGPSSGIDPSGPSTSASTTKRARFDEATTAQHDGATGSGGGDGDTTGLDLDLEEQDRKRAQQGRRGRVVTAGYDSDDDEDEEGDDAGGEDQGADDEDMFGDEEPGDAKGKEKGKGKEGDGEEGRFLQLGEIEGQEFGKVSRAPDNEDAELSEDDDDDDEEKDAELELESDEGSEDSLLDNANGAAERTPSPLLGPDGEVLAEDSAALERRREERAKAARRSKRKQGMGFRLDKFNMKDEMATGRFDAEGNYTANERDPHAEHDKWLEGHYSRKGIRAAREARKRREEDERRKEEELGAHDEDEVKQQLVPLLERGESVMEALQRLGKEADKWRPNAGVKKKKSYGAKNKQRNGTSPAPMDVDAPSEAAAMAAPTQHPSIAALETLTSLSSTLMSRFGHTGIYDETYESLLRAVRRAGLVRADWDPARAKEQEREAADSLGASNADAATTATNISSTSSAPVDASGVSGHYSYKWTPAYLSASARLTGQPVDPETRIFGPYGVQELKEWCEGGFFGEGGERVLLRREEGEGTEEQRGQWRRWGEVFK